LIAYALIRLRGRDRRRAIGVLLAALVIAAALWGRGLYWQTRMAPSLDPSYLREDLPHHALQTIVRILKLPLIYLVGDELATAVPLAGHIAVALIVLFLPIVQLRRRKDLLIWVLWIWAVIGMATAIDLAHDSTILKVSRYTVLAAPAAFAILAAFDWPAQMRWRNALPLALIACLAVTNGLRLRRPPQPKQDFQFLSQIVDARAAPDELLVFYNDSGWVSPGVWYVCYRYYSPQSRHPWMALHHPADASALAQLRNHKILWLIGRQPEIDGPTVLPGWVPQEVWPTSAGRVCLMRKLPNAP
jgi:hypothetical protein